MRSLLLFLLNSFKTDAQLKLEIIILTKQIEILQRSNTKITIKNSDRLFFSLMKNLLSNWKERLFIVKPETVIKWLGLVSVQNSISAKLAKIRVIKPPFLNFVDSTIVLIDGAGANGIKHM